MISNFLLKICNTRPVILGILLSISITLAFISVFLARSLASGISLSVSLIFLVFQKNPVISKLSTLATNLSYSVFLTTSFLTTLLSLTK